VDNEGILTSDAPIPADQYSMSKQVDKSHYKFESYMGKSRWASVWHQLDEVIKMEPERVLEIGPGPGIFKAAATALGINVETLDIDPELAPDYVGSALQIPLPDASCDVVCAFQMLEHLPWEDGKQAFREMVRVADKGIVVSLPDAAVLWPNSIYIPKIGKFNFFIPRQSVRREVHEFDGEHYWEINKRGYPLKRILREFFEVSSISLLTTYRVHENPYHRFFVFAKY